jgi:hypothetical protein
MSSTNNDDRAARGERICYIHIGTHKTGTTSLQAFVAANLDRFAESGIVWPAAGRVDDAGVVAHHHLAKDLLGNPAFDPARGGLEAVVAELRQSTAHTACLTSEDLCFLYDAPGVLQRLRDGIRSAGFEPRIVVYLRAQASYCAAVYAENVRHGYRVSFADYFADVLRRGCYVWGGGTGPPFDYNDLLDGFAAVFGRSAIVGRTYRSSAPSTQLVHSFARLLLPAGVDVRTFTMPAIRYNGSLGFAGVLRLLGVTNDLSPRLRFTPLTLGSALRLSARFAVPNARLALRYRVAVPVLEPLDLALALPIRRTAAQTRALAQARAALAGSACDQGVFVK